MNETINERHFETLLTAAMEAFAGSEDAEEYLEDTDSIDVDTFEGAGILTMNKGLVVQIGDAEFQVTIVRSR